MGTPKSQAFCDSIDLFVVRQQQHDSPEDRLYQLQEANIMETVRQRKNETPGYTPAFYNSIDLSAVLQRAMSDKADGKFDEKVLNHHVSYELNTLKMDYIQAVSAKQGQKATQI